MHYVTEKVFLESNHPYNYRDNQNENALVEEVVMFRLETSGIERLCYKVKYLSDDFVDFIPFKNVEEGNYLFTKQQHKTIQ